MAKSKAVLDKMPESQIDELIEWLTIEGITYEAARERLAELYQVEVGLTQLCNFYQRHCLGYKHRRARKLAAEVGTLFAESTDFNQITVKALEQRAFELALAKDGSIEDLQALAKIIGDSQRLDLQARKLDVDERKLKLLEQKAAAYDKVDEAAKDDSLTPEERLKKVREGLKI